MSPAGLDFLGIVIISERDFLFLTREKKVVLEENILMAKIEQRSGKMEKTLVLSSQMRWNAALLAGSLLYMKKRDLT